MVLPEPCEVKPLGNVKATFNAQVNPEGVATTSHFQYITEADYQADGESFGAGTEVTPESPPIGSDFELHAATAQASDLVPETEYRCRVVASDADGNESLGEAGAFTTRPPFEFGAAWTTAVGSESASISAEVNPLGIRASGHFEYVDDADFRQDGFARATKVPAGGIDLGAGESFETQTVELSSLEPGTLYHFRLVAEDRFDEDAGPERTFRTFQTGADALPDGRAYEMVSPPQKNSAEVAVPLLAGDQRGGLFNENSFVRTQAAAGSGEAFTYTSWTSFGEPQGAPGTSQYLARRTAGGWVTENVSPLGFQRNALNPPYRGFTPDLGFGAIALSEPPLTADAIAGFENLYLRDDATGALRALTVATPRGTSKKDFCTGFAGASRDGSRAFFAANAALTRDAPEGAGFSLYEWSAGEGLKLLSRLASSGEPAAAPSQATGFGAGGGACSMGHKVAHNVISADGRTAFWTYASSGGDTQLLARVGGRKTIQLDAKERLAHGESGDGVFQAASSDGSTVFFTDGNQLVPGASNDPTKPDLYRYDLDASSEPLTDLTLGSEPAGVLGVLAAADDGSYVYFAATAKLTGEEENARHEKAQAGSDNLYVFHEGGGVRFIATLASGDADDWSGSPSANTSRATADGRYLAFTSEASLTGYDNSIGAGGCHFETQTQSGLSGSPDCQEAFLYDAEAGELTCASCNPSGAKPLGPTLLPESSNPYEAPRVLSGDGRRLFFESFDALSPRDQNESLDAYEFERQGSGACGAASPEFDPGSGGCIFLLSSGGRDDDYSYLLDASADGRDVFIATRSRLVDWDVDDNYDVYDVRIGGGFPEPTAPAAPCAGESSCRAPAGVAPSVGPPATDSFSGPGNPKPHHHRKKVKKRRHGHHHRTRHAAKHPKRKHAGKGKHAKGKKGKAAHSRRRGR